MVSLLSDSDSLHLIAISDKVTQFVRGDTWDCVKNSSIGLHSATMDNKVQLFKFIDQLNKTKGKWIEQSSKPLIIIINRHSLSLAENTNHSLGFQAAFDFLRSSESTKYSPDDEVIFLYVSRGLLSLAEAKTVLETIATGQGRLQRPVVINTCAIIIGRWILRCLMVNLLINSLLLCLNPQMKRESCTNVISSGT